MSYFLNTESIIQNINEHTIITSGYLSVKDTIGKTVRIAAKKKAADFSLAHDALVVETNQLKIAIESFVRIIDDASFSAMSIKFPWYDQDNKIIGIFGCSLVPDAKYGPFSLAEPLSLLMQTGLLNQNNLSQQFLTPQNNFSHANILPQSDTNRLSKRELDCLYYFVKGMTAKKIAICMSLSNRTVEKHIETIKKKLNANSRIDLYEKAMLLDAIQVKLKNQ